MKRILWPAIVAGCIAGIRTGADCGPFTSADDPPANSAASTQDSASAEADHRHEEPSPPRTQWLMFTAEWCPACRAARADFEAWLARGKWKVDSSAEAHLRIVDADREPELVRRWRIRSFPTFVLVQGERESARTEGYPGRAELVRRYREADEAAAKTVAAITVGALKGEQRNIADFIAGIRPLLGDAGALTVSLNRRGGKAAILPLGERITIVAENPLTMTYALKGDVLECRFAEPLPRGRFTFGVPVEQEVSAVTLSVSEAVIELPRAPDLRLRVEP